MHRPKYRTQVSRVSQVTLAANRLIELALGSELRIGTSKRPYRHSCPDRRQCGVIPAALHRSLAARTGFRKVW
jgi:hypothetical protein